MPLGRRRPLMRAAMVGGAAYARGKQVQRRQEHEAEQDQMIAEAQQRAAAPQAPAPTPPLAAPQAPSSSVDRIDALTQLKNLLDAGVLNQAEFEREKQRILQES